LTAILATATCIITAWSVYLYVTSSVILKHPAKAVGRNEMPFSRDIHVVPSNIALEQNIDRGTGLPMWMGDLVAGTPSSQQCCLLPDDFGPIWV